MNSNRMWYTCKASKICPPSPQLKQTVRNSCRFLFVVEGSLARGCVEPGAKALGCARQLSAPSVLTHSPAPDFPRPSIPCDFHCNLTWEGDPLDIDKIDIFGCDNESKSGHTILAPLTPMSLLLAAWGPKKTFWLKMPSFGPLKVPDEPNGMRRTQGPLEGLFCGFAIATFGSSHNSRQRTTALWIFSFSCDGAYPHPYKSSTYSWVTEACQCNVSQEWVKMVWVDITCEEIT